MQNQHAAAGGMQRHMQRGMQPHMQQHAAACMKKHAAACSSTQQHAAAYGGSSNYDGSNNRAGFEL